MPDEGSSRKTLDPEALAVLRADITALHQAVQLTNPLPSGTARFSAEKLTSLYSQMAGFGFESFALIPVGAQMATLPARQAVISLDRTVLTEQFAISGSSLRPFGELASMLLDKVQSVLDVQGYRAVVLKLVAYWPVGNGDALSFVSKAVSIGESVTLRLGSGFDVAGVRFHRGRKGERDEWNVRVEPMLMEPDKLWIEIDVTSGKPFNAGAEVGNKLEEVERFLRNEVQNAVLAMAQDHRRTD